jgi:integrase
MSKRDIVSEYLRENSKYRKELSQARKSGQTKPKHPPSPRVLLDEALCDWLPVMDYEYVVRDEEVMRLHIRVRPTGGKHFEIMKKLGGKQMRQKVCVFGDHLKLKGHKVPKGEPPPETVRSRANRLMLDLERGISPTQKRAEKAVEAAKKAQAAAVEARDSLTLFAAAQDYIEMAELAVATKNNYTTYLNKHLADWRDQPIVSIGVDEVIHIQKTIASERGDIAANNALRLFRAVWNVVAEDNPDMGLCPTYVLSKKSKKKVQWATEERRDRYVHEKELAVWWASVEKLREPKSFPGDGNLMADYLLFALLTGMRRSEISNLKWKNINFTREELHLTAKQNLKGKRMWTIPLTPPLLEILNRRKAMEVAVPFEVKEPRRAITRVKDWSNVEFSMHDLRRSFASHAEATRMPLKTLKLLMNHATDSDVTLGYIRNKDVLLKELQILHNYILDKAGVTSNIVALEAANG